MENLPSSSNESNVGAKEAREERLDKTSGMEGAMNLGRVYVDGKGRERYSPSVRS